MPNPTLMRWVVCRAKSGSVIAFTPHEYESTYVRDTTIQVVWRGVASDYRAAVLAGYRETS